VLPCVLAHRGGGSDQRVGGHPVRIFMSRFKHRTVRPKFLIVFLAGPELAAVVARAYSIATCCDTARLKGEITYIIGVKNNVLLFEDCGGARCIQTILFATVVLHVTSSK